MKTTIFSMLLLLSSPSIAQQAVPLTVCFSPEGHCAAKIVAQVAAAKTSVLMLAYGFTSEPIAQALVNAAARGVKVEVVVDRSNRNGKYSEISLLRQNKIPVLIDSRHQIAHNKVLIIDALSVFTGSFNFTKAAEEHNAENLLLIRDAGLAAKYLDNYKLHRAHSR